MPTNDFLPFCPTDTGTNLVPQATYLTLTTRTNGVQPGIASSTLNNKSIRQANVIASQFAQWVCNKTGVNMLDDGNLATTLANITAALASLTPTYAVPQLTVLQGGTGTYTVPAGAAYIEVQAVGGGGGGAGSGTGAGGGNGTNGGDTTFSGGSITLTAGQGKGGTPNQSGASAGAGGGASLGIVTSGYVIGGAYGSFPASDNTSPISTLGGLGGMSVFGGSGFAAGGSNGVAGGNAVGNTGAGGGGGTGKGQPGVLGGGGGGAGGYLYALLSGTNLLASYSYSIGGGGPGGSAGTSGYAGGNGAAGMIIIKAYFV